MAKYDRLFFDIETIANEKVLPIMPAPKAPANLKDPVKIAAALEEAKAEMIDKMPLDSDYGKIKLITFQVGFKGEPQAIYADNEQEEGQCLLEFWRAYIECGGRSVGFNILAFDLPFVVKRSMALGIRPSILPNLVKYRSEPTTDLYMLLCGWDYRGGHKLKWIAKRYGIEVPYPDVDGSMVGQMSREVLVRYGLSDLAVTIDLFNMMNGYYFVM